MDRSLASSPDFILTPEAFPFPGAPPAPAERGDRVSNLSLFPELEPLFGDEGPFQLQAEQVLESMSDGFVFLDREWRYRYINGKADEFHLRHGRTHGQLIGRTVWECFPEAEGSELGGCLRAAGATGRVAECAVHDESTGAWQECRIVPGPGGTAIYLRDVTERKRVEAEQALLAAAGQALAGSLDPRELLRRAAPLPLPLLGRWCFAYLIEDDGSVQALEAACLVPEKVETYRELVRRFPGAASETHPFVQSVRGGRTVLVPQVTDETFAALSDDAEFRALARKMAPVSLLGVPLLARGRTLGALAFATDEPGRRFDARDAALAGELATRVALAFDNARLYRDARLAASRSEEALALLDSLFRGAPIGLAFLDPELRYVAINDALARTNGLPAPAHLGRTVGEAIPACSRIVEPQLRRVLETGEPIVDWEWSAEVPSHPGEVRHWLESFYPVVGDEGRVLGVGVALAEITAIRRAEDVQRFLAEVSRLVAPVLDGEEWLEQLPRSALPRLGDYCVIDLAGDDGGVRSSVIAHVDPEKERVARELRRVYPIQARPAGSSVPRVLRTGEPEVVLEVPHGYVDDTVEGEERRALLREIAPNSYLVLPLRARGRTLGTMSFVMSEPGRRHTPGDVALAEELVRRVALAIDNARLYEAERAAAARMSRLFAMTAALSGAVTPAEVADAVVTHGMRDLGASQGMLALPTADGAALELVGPRGVPAELARRWERFPVEAPVPLADAFRLRRPVLIETAAEYDARYPGLSEENRSVGNRACAVLPLEVDGRVLGSLAFTFAHERAFTAADRAFLETVARQCAQALERARLYEAEQRARAEAEGANRAKSDFLATMSHELRTPLNAIAGYVELLEMKIHGPVGEKQLDALRRIQRNQRHLLGLINDVLNFARMETGRLSLRVEPVDVGEALAGLEPLVAPQLSARALRYDCRLPAARLAVRADPERLHQVLLNLLSNAVKFTEPGGAVTVEAGPSEGGETVEIRVRDTGLGIPAEKLEEIFEPFVQLDRGLTRTSEGTGLGLAISRDLARAMTGDLRAGPNPGGGSVFTLTLPPG